MKGPYERLKYDLRRRWECPRCEATERRGGEFTYVFCERCAEDGSPTPMRLADEGGPIGETDASDPG